MDSLDVLAPKPELVHSFFVESADGSINLGNLAVVEPNHSEINDALARYHPNTFNRKSGAIPLHIACRGTMPSDDALLFAVPIHDGYNCLGGKITVSVLVDNDGDRRVAHVPWRRSWSGVLTPVLAPFSSSGNKSNWHEIRCKESTKTDLGRDKDRIAEIIASGVVKALNGMSPDQMEKLVARAHRTNEQRRAVEWLSGSTSTTFSVSEDGSLFVESEHAFTPVPVDFADLSKIPEIVQQSFDANTRTGKVEADVTGCDENLAIDYLLGRLVPEICRTKSVVLDPVKDPPRGARYKVTSVKRGPLHEKDIVQISFTALQ